LNGGDVADELAAVNQTRAENRAFDLYVFV
jgi:hypothetical protein